MRKLNVLFIDDEKENLNAFQAAFRRDFSVYLCDNTIKAKEIIENNTIHVIISDHRMPGESGLTFFERIAKSQPQIMRILITAYGDFNLIQRSINNGNIFRFVNKPWDIDFLKSAIKDAGEIFLLNEKNAQLKQSYIQLFNDSPSLLIIVKDNNIEVINRAAKSIFSIDESLTCTNPSLKDILGCEVDTENESVINYSYQGKEIELQITPKNITLDSEEHTLFTIVDVSNTLAEERKMKRLVAEIEQNERSKIAMEIHDGLGQELVLLKLMAEGLMMTNESSKDQEVMLFESIQETIKKTRNLSYNMSPPELENGLLKSLQALIIKITPLTKICFITDISEEASSEWLKLNLSQELNYQLYRVVQEFLNNSIQHSKATKCYMSVSFNSNDISLTLKDNGIGFNEAENSLGKGLENMKYRMDSNKLNYSLEGDIGRGVELKIRWKRNTILKG